MLYRLMWTCFCLKNCSQYIRSANLAGLYHGRLRTAGINLNKEAKVNYHVKFLWLCLHIHFLLYEMSHQRKAFHLNCFGQIRLLALSEILTFGREFDEKFHEVRRVARIGHVINCVNKVRIFELA